MGRADEFEEVWVVVGPLFEEERDPLDSGIPVPSGFFYIVVDEQENGQPRALAFINCLYGQGLRFLVPGGAAGGRGCDGGGALAGTTGNKTGPYQ